jgi:hypothetical protein
VKKEEYDHFWWIHLITMCICSCCRIYRSSYDHAINAKWNEESAVLAVVNYTYLLRWTHMHGRMRMNTGRGRRILTHGAKRLDLIQTAGDFVSIEPVVCVTFVLTLESDTVVRRSVVLTQWRYGAGMLA